MTQNLRLVGYLLGGRPGSRLLDRLGMKGSRDTVLRRVKTESAPETETKVRVLGVDDWAWRKRQEYGTMLMDLEQRRVVDLLPVRSAASFADWLRKHPGVEIIARARSYYIPVARNPRRISIAGNDPPSAIDSAPAGDRIARESIHGQFPF